MQRLKRQQGPAGTPEPALAASKEPRSARKAPRSDPRLDAGRGGRKPRGTGAAFVYERLRAEILSLEMKPGTPLDEAGLARRFRLSRSPVREAIIRLASDGLVTMFPNRSSIVAPLDLGLIPCHLDALELMQRLTTRLAARNRTAADLARIEAAAAKFAEAVTERRLPEMINANYDYHMAIAEAGANPYFTALYGRLLDEGRRMLHMHFSFAAENRARGLETLLAEHAAITAAIRAGDLDRAEDLAYRHSVEFRRRFASYLERSSATAEVSLSSVVGHRVAG